ncbi:MAG: hypothetical protein RLZ12_38 [Bacillota bacterium]
MKRLLKNEFRLMGGLFFIMLAVLSLGFLLSSNIWLVIGIKYLEGFTLVFGTLNGLLLVSLWRDRKKFLSKSSHAKFKSINIKLWVCTALSSFILYLTFLQMWSKTKYFKLILVHSCQIALGCIIRPVFFGTLAIVLYVLYKKLRNHFKLPLVLALICCSIVGIIGGVWLLHRVFFVPLFISSLFSTLQAYSLSLEAAGLPYFAREIFEAIEAFFWSGIFYTGSFFVARTYRSVK